MDLFLALWDEIGSILLEVLREDLSERFFHPKLINIIIILLAKRHGQLLVGNQCGVTLY